jgi:CheY-like chemotaxis protein
MILVVDDSQDGRDILCRLLGARGYPCESVGSGSEALAFIRHHPAEQPLLVVLDEMMPDMDGIAVLKEIRRDPNLARVTVLMFSAAHNIPLREYATALGASAWLLKGESRAFEKIAQWYERIGGTASTTTPARNAPPQSQG